MASRSLLMFRYHGSIRVALAPREHDCGLNAWKCKSMREASHSNFNVAPCARVVDSIGWGLSTMDPLLFLESGSFAWHHSLGIFGLRSVAQELMNFLRDPFSGPWGSDLWFEALRLVLLGLGSLAWEFRLESPESYYWDVWLRIFGSWVFGLRS